MWMMCKKLLTFCKEKYNKVSAILSDLGEGSKFKGLLRIIPFTIIRFFMNIKKGV